MEHGLDVATTPIPVAPAAHYMMGGIKVDGGGMSTIKALYACGEVACTTVHGANRLASNSLLESLVFAKRIVDHTQGNLASVPSIQRRVEMVVLPHRRHIADTPSLHLKALQDMVWDRVGIVRNGEDLRRAAEILYAWSEAAPAPTDRSSHELVNLLTVARLMTEAALIREESRGAHYRTSFPHPSPEWEKHIVLVKEEAS
jgi:L-aspartate oxidase